MDERIETPRLQLATMGEEVLQASLAGDRARAEALLGAALPPDWPPHPEIFALRLEQLAADPGALPWLTRAIVEKEQGVVVGVSGFHGPPGDESLSAYAPGGVEFGYTVFEPYRGRGIATECGRGLVDWASSRHGIRFFVVSMAPGNAASAGVARRLGFTRVGTWRHEERGIEHVYRLEVESAGGPGASG